MDSRAKALTSDVQGRKAQRPPPVKGLGVSCSGFRNVRCPPLLLFVVVHVAAHVAFSKVVVLHVRTTEMRSD